jgi:ABC-2 family transporter protein
MSAHASFRGLLLAEWTKLRSVSRWVLTLFGAVALTIGLSYLAASANKWDARGQSLYATGPLGKPVSDSFYFVHQQVTGDTTLTLHVASVTRVPDERPADPGNEGLSKINNPSPWAQPAGGIMIKDGSTTGSSYAAVLLTPSEGVRMQWDYHADRAGSASAGSAGRWLRMVRSGATITGYESADGVSWTKISTATPKHLSATVEVGFYVSSPEDLYTSRGAGSSSLGAIPTLTDATFDHVQLASAGPWVGASMGYQPPGDKADHPSPGRYREDNGTFTVRGTGLIGPSAPDDDLMEAALIGVIAGLMALIAVGVLYATSEYRRGMIRTTFLATPRRGRVLAAKALVLGGTAYLVSLVGVLGSYLLAIPALRHNGFVPPAFPEPSLADGAVLRTVLLTAGFMTGVALVGLGMGVLLRHSAAAITVTVVLVLLPLILGMILPGTSSPKWLMYTTLAGGMATERAKPPTITLAEPWALIGPWPAITVVAAWVAVALGLAWWRLRTRDV